MSMDLFDDSEYERRLKNLNNIEVDQLILFNRPDLFYYSGTGLDGVLFKSGKENVRYIRRNIELGKNESKIKTEFMPSFRTFRDIGKNNNIGKLGLELDMLPYKTVKYLEKTLNPVNIVDISEQLRIIRSVKSDKEQYYMKIAAKQTDESFEDVVDLIKPGMTELEISAKIEYFLRRDGHPGYINVRMFQHNLTSLSYVMAGDSTASLNSVFGPVSGQGNCRLHKNGPSKRKIKNNEVVLIDTTGVYEGYTADETRSIFIGKPEDNLYHGLEVAKEIQKYCEKNMIEGKKPSELYIELIQMANEYGLSENFMGYRQDRVPFIGHGIGLELDEFPIITEKYERELKEGNIIAVEPKFIFDNPKSGVGIEDSYIVRKGKAERITKHPW
ncbi:MAG: M24 family metallopeptidase [Candidatus Kariarchaeum pelagius]